MALVDTIVRTVHLWFAALWTGSVLFFAVGALRSRHESGVGAAAIETLAGSLRTVSRLSALFLFVTGGHLAASAYTVGSLTGTFRGWLVLAMLALWLVLAGLVEVGASKFADGDVAGGVPFARGAAVVAALVLVDAGLLAAGFAP